jgi:type II secretion system protein N
MKETLIARLKELAGKYSKYARFVGYPIFYFVCLGLFARVFFPYARLKERIVATYNQAQVDSGGKSELQIDEMTGHLLTGVTLVGVHISLAPSEPGKPIGRLDLDDVTIRPGFGGSVAFDADAFGGQVSGSLDHADKDQSIDLTLDSIDLSNVEPVSRGFATMIRDALKPLNPGGGGPEAPPVPIHATISGAIHLVMPGGRTAKANGTVSVDIRDMSIGDGNPKSTGGLALPRLDVGNITFAGDVKEGVLKVTKLSGGKDLELAGEGRINLRERFGDWLCDLLVRFRLSDGYRGRSEVTRSLFGAPGSTAPSVFEMADQRVRSAKRADGFFAFAVRGPVDHLDFSPSGTGGATGFTTYGGPPSGGTSGSPRQP